MQRTAKIATAILTIITFGSILLPEFHKNKLAVQAIHDKQEKLEEAVKTLSEHELEAINSLQANGPTIEEDTPPQEPEIQFFTDRIPLENIVVFDDHPLGSCGWLEEGWDGQFIRCGGINPGDVCMIRIRTKRDTEWQYIQTCGKTETPIAHFDMETQEWVICYDKKVQLL